MAITAVAAFAGAAVATTATAAVVTYVAIAAAVVTVVGVATKNSTLTKIGSGLGLGMAIGSWVGPATAGAGSSSAANASQLGTGTAEAAGTAAETAAGSAAQTATAGAGNVSEAKNLRLSEGGSDATYGSQAAPGSAAPTTADGARIRTVGNGYGESSPSGIIDAAAETSTVAQPAGVAQVADVAGVAQPGSFNSTGTTLRSMEGGTNAVYNGSSANGGSNYWESIGQFWKGLDSGDKQIVGGIVKGVGQGAASYIGERQKTQSQIDAENRLIERRSNFTPVTWRTK